MKRIGLCGLVCLAFFAIAARSQEPASGTSQNKTVQKVPVEHTSASSGQQMYVSYCAVCHGKGGKGDGPAAAALKAPPPDLTMLAKNNNGTFPAEHVEHVLQFGVDAPAHGAKDMPIWGPLLSSLQGKTSGGDALVQLRVRNLTNYIQSLQAK